MKPWVLPRASLPKRWGARVVKLSMEAPFVLKMRQHCLQWVMQSRGVQVCPLVLMKTMLILTLEVFSHMLINMSPTHGLLRWCSGSLAPYKDDPVTGALTKVTCRWAVDSWLKFTDCSKERTYRVASEVRQKEDAVSSGGVAFPALPQFCAIRWGCFCHSIRALWFPSCLFPLKRLMCLRSNPSRTS